MIRNLLKAFGCAVSAGWGEAKYNFLMHWRARKELKATSEWWADQVDKEK